MPNKKRAMMIITNEFATLLVPITIAPKIEKALLTKSVPFLQN